MKISSHASFMLALCPLVLDMSGCGDQPDTQPPTVLSTSPATEATGVATTAALTVTFSEPMDAATINAATFVLNESGGGPTSGTVSTSGATATFTPSSSLHHLTQYTATITTGVKDLAGNAMAASRTWSFTVVTTPSPLISAQTLKTWIDNGTVNGTGQNRVVVLDVTSAPSYAAGHILGAQLLTSTDLFQNRQEGPAVGTNMVLDGPHMDALVRAMGIDGNTTVVFTSAAVTSATTAYFTFRYWGFPKGMLKVLDGLNPTWTTTYGLTTSASPSITPSAYSVKSNAGLRAELRASLSEMMNVASGSVANAVILDARGTSAVGSYAGIPGSTAGVFPPGSDFVVFEGHMKGARALDYTTLYDATTLQFKAPDVLKTMFATAGIDNTKTTYAHCRTSVIASAPFFVLDGILGWPAVAYDGSWSQWGQMSANSANGGQLAADSPWRTDLPGFSDVVVYNHPTASVERLSFDGAVCSSTLSVTNVITYNPSACTPTPPDSNAAPGDQIEDADAAYMAAH